MSEGYWDLTVLTGSREGLEIRKINYPEGIKLSRNAECPYTIDVDHEEDASTPVETPNDEGKWWSEYALGRGVESVCKTVTTGNVTETICVQFDTAGK